MGQESVENKTTHKPFKVQREVSNHPVFVILIAAYRLLFQILNLWVHVALWQVKKAGERSISNHISATQSEERSV